MPAYQGCEPERMYLIGIGEPQTINVIKMVKEIHSKGFEEDHPELTRLLPKSLERYDFK